MAVHLEGRVEAKIDRALCFRAGRLLREIGQGPPPVAGPLRFSLAPRP